MRPSVRFEVFKRDGFACAYCGRKPPDVTLEADHIIPVAEGGDDDLANLITACWDCNRGKGADLLDDHAPVSLDLEERAELIRERERQLRLYHAARAEEVARREQQLERVYAHWYTVWGDADLYRWHMPWDSTLRKYVDELGGESVMEAMDITGSRFQRISTKAVRYFVGILKRMAAER